MTTSSALLHTGLSSLLAVVFDCDGVLFDSKQANIHFYNHILREVGRPPLGAHQEDYVHMHSARESLQFLLEDESLVAKAWQLCLDLDFRRFNRYLRPEPGLKRTLEALRPRYRLALATNRTVSTREVLSHFQLDGYFDLIMTASDVAHPKPHPEIMQRILAAFRIAPRHVLFVGDSAVDEQLAAATGVYFAAYKNPELDGHFHLTHMVELLKLLDVPLTAEESRSS